jgi:proteasome alpha subunit
MPFYVSPEQQMKDRADYARKGIARGPQRRRAAYEAGVLFVARTPSRALHKISEIYDRIAFAAVGKYNEFENLRHRRRPLRRPARLLLRPAGRHRAAGLANAFAQTLGTVFSGPRSRTRSRSSSRRSGSSDEDQIYRLTYDGSVADERGFVAMGGSAEAITATLQQRWDDGLRAGRRVKLAVEVLAAPTEPGGSPREIASAQLEVAVLDRHRPRRKFRRLVGAVLERLLDGGPPVQEPKADDPAVRDVSPPTSLAGGAHEPAGPDRSATHADEAARGEA